jgi:hypothetical protein
MCLIFFYYENIFKKKIQSNFIWNGNQLFFIFFHFYVKQLIARMIAAEFKKS